MRDWIDWNGGECPVDPGTQVEVRLRDGRGVVGLADNLHWRKECAISDIIAYRVVEVAKSQAPIERAMAAAADSALTNQVGGDHYKKLAIQPIEYIHANNIPFPEGSAIKYLTRWRDKGGVNDLEKAKHLIDLLIELETRR